MCILTRSHRNLPIWKLYYFQRFEWANRDGGGSENRLRASPNNRREYAVPTYGRPVQPGRFEETDWAGPWRAIYRMVRQKNKDLRTNLCSATIDLHAVRNVPNLSPPVSRMRVLAAGAVTRRVHNRLSG